MVAYLRFYCLLALGLVMASCSGLNVEKTPLGQPELPPENAQPSPIGFNKVRYAIPTGTPVISYSPRGLTGFFTCAGPYGAIEGGMQLRSYPDDNFRQIFLDTMEGAGYDVAGDPGRMFDEEEDEMRATYSIGARVTDMKVDLCREVNFWSIQQGVSGESSLTVEWTVYDLLNRKNVYKTVTKGYAVRKIPNYEGIPLLMQDSFAAAAHNLGADKNFYNLVFNGEAPTQEPYTEENPYEEPITIYKPDEAVSLEKQPLSRIAAKEHLDELARTAVLIQAAHTHGSGFFITSQGHILTNAHVVGNATRVRVVTSGKHDKLIAEVLRLDRRRDVALLRLEKMPDELLVQPLSVRLAKPKVGEDVYSIGAPETTRLQDTVTKGIVSALRVDPRERQPYIQADVAIYPGSSGGPLLDEYGNIVGLSVSGYQDGDVGLDALNNFIPIEDALKRLDIGAE